MSEIGRASPGYLNTTNFTKREPFSSIHHASQQAIIFTHENPFLTLYAN